MFQPAFSRYAAVEAIAQPAQHGEELLDLALAAAFLSGSLDPIMAEAIGTDTSEADGTGPADDAPSFEDGALLRSGEPLTALAHLEPDAWLANCSAPEAMEAALETLATFGKPFGAYANGFTQITKDFLKDKPTVDALRVRRDFTPENYADHVMGWVDAGATIVGGCCEVGPAHIAEIARRLKDAGHTIV